MIQYRWTNHVDVDTINIPFCLCTLYVLIGNRIYLVKCCDIYLS